MLPDALPPTVQFLLSEGLQRLSSVTDFRRRLGRRRLRDLRDQAVYSLEEWRYADAEETPRTGDLVVVPSEWLNPLALPSSKCASPQCRGRDARFVARSLGLYADRVVLPDVISFVAADEDLLTPDELSQFLIGALTAVVELLPLIENGVVKFGRPRAYFCQHCDAAMTRAAGDALSAVLDFVLGEVIAVTLDEVEGITVLRIRFSDEAFGIAIGIDVPEDAKSRVVQLVGESTQAHRCRELSALPWLREAVWETLRETLFPLGDALKSAHMTGGTLTGATRVETDFLRNIESGLPFGKDPVDRAVVRPLTLPWVRDLSVAQVVQLKEEAQHALPAFRALFATRLSDPAASDAELREVARELEREALDVQAELGSWDRARGGRFHIGLGSHGLAFMLYGLTVAKDVAATAIGTYITALAAVHPERHKERVERERLKTRPGYVLLRAKELLGHAD
jgi:hypothetical protein